jgi:hypothetical protein
MLPAMLLVKHMASAPKKSGDVWGYVFLMSYLHIADWQCMEWWYADRVLRGCKRLMALPSSSTLTCGREYRGALE